MPIRRARVNASGFRLRAASFLAHRDKAPRIGFWFRCDSLPYLDVLNVVVKLLGPFLCVLIRGNDTPLSIKGLGVGRRGGLCGPPAGRRAASPGPFLFRRLNGREGGL